jgi:hypothetical protein
MLWQRSQVCEGNGIGDANDSFRFMLPTNGDPVSGQLVENFPKIFPTPWKSHRWMSLDPQPVRCSYSLPPA